MVTMSQAPCNVRSQQQYISADFTESANHLSPTSCRKAQKINGTTTESGVPLTNTKTKLDLTKLFSRYRRDNYKCKCSMFAQNSQEKYEKIVSSPSILTVSPLRFPATALNNSFKKRKNAPNVVPDKHQQV